METTNKNTWPLVLIVLALIAAVIILGYKWLSNTAQQTTANRYQNAIMYDPLVYHSNTDNLGQYRNDSVGGSGSGGGLSALLGGISQNQN